jgi:hypothetical protein
MGLMREPWGGVRLRAKDEPPPPATAPIASPDDPEARCRTRSGTSWVGYVVDFPPENGGVGSECHAAASILMSSMSALASTGVR